METYWDEPQEYSCLECGQVFTVPEGVLADYYCSQACRGLDFSKKNIEHLSRLILKREGWRYVRVSQFLNPKGVIYQFEYPLGPYIYDLALVDAKIFIEFDEPYHDRKEQQVKGLEKERYAESQGWKLFRCPSKSNTSFPVLFVEEICRLYVDEDIKVPNPFKQQTMYGRMYKK